jgi:hypothetical protein
VFNGPGNVYIRKQNITTSAAVFYFDYHSQYGVFLKFNEELKLSANAGDELLAQLDDVSYISPQTRSLETGSIQLYRNGLNVYGVVNGAGRFIANSGAELKTYLDGLVTLPAGKPYSGNIYRYKTTGASYNVTDINPNMNPLENRFKTGLYVSTTSDGNLLEAIGNGGVTGKAQYEITNVQITNLLDLTDYAIIQQIGTSFEQMKFSSPNKIVAYEFTHVVADWAKSKGYSGIKFYGAHGSEVVYENILIFEQTTVNNSIANSSIIELEW